jgi:hypothetical protein
MKHKGKVLTTEEVMENRSSKYEFVDFDEALEKTAKNYYNNFEKRKEEFAFIDGAKWQQERSYTEKEVKEIVWESRKFFHNYKDTPFNKVRDVEQFKKK